MSKQGWGFLAGAGMGIGGLVLYVAFLDAETPVIGLLQAGLIIVVVGVIELVATGGSTLRSRRPYD